MDMHGQPPPMLIHMRLARLIGWGLPSDPPCPPPPHTHTSSSYVSLPSPMFSLPFEPAAAWAEWKENLTLAPSLVAHMAATQLKSIVALASSTSPGNFFW